MRNRGLLNSAVQLGGNTRAPSASSIGRSHLVLATAGVDQPSMLTLVLLVVLPTPESAKAGSASTRIADSIDVRARSRTQATISRRRVSCHNPNALHSPSNIQMLGDYGGGDGNNDGHNDGDNDDDHGGGDERENGGENGNDNNDGDDDGDDDYEN